MIIFAAMLIPFITSIVLWVRFRHATKWWEFLTPFGLSFVLALIFHYTTSFIKTNKTEYWTGWITKAVYTEQWKEKVYYTEKVPDGTETYYDSKGKKRTRTKYKTVIKSRIDTHPPFWTGYESNGKTYSINSSLYNQFEKRWNGSRFMELNRQLTSEVVSDGDQYVTEFNNQEESMEVATSLHRYENKVAVSRSVFNFPEIKPEVKNQFGLVDYPKLIGDWEMPCVLGANVYGSKAADRRLSVFNAKHGRSSQVRVWLIVFKDQTLEAAFQQQNYWKNGNMNEFVICVGVDSDDKVLWGHSFSWTDVSILPIEARDIVNAQQGKRINFGPIISWIEESIPSRWIRKDFKKDFNYINVAPPVWAIILTFLLTAGANVGLSFWLVKNEFKE